MTEFGAIRVFSEKISTRAANRPETEKAVALVSTRDTLRALRDDGVWFDSRAWIITARRH